MSPLPSDKFLLVYHTFRLPKTGVDRGGGLGYIEKMGDYLRLIIAVLCIIGLAQSTEAANSARNFGGVGIDGVPWADGRIVVRQLVAGGPAQQAGMKVGDVITHIDGKQTRGSDFRQMVERRLRGVAGTPVTIRVHRPGEPGSRTFTLIRRQLVISGK
jgi:membrane-associated protease RseP (regulator of RpoE activity)